MCGDSVLRCTLSFLKEKKGNQNVTLGKIRSVDKVQIRKMVSSFRYKPRFPVAMDNGSTLWSALKYHYQ